MEDRPKKKRRRLWRTFKVLFVIALVPWIVTQVLGYPNIVTRTSELPPAGARSHRVALVLGAGIRGGHPTPILTDRLMAAKDAFNVGVVDRVLVSGDNQRDGYDEPTAMRQWLVRNGVDSTKVAADYGGRRTRDSCKRANDVFGIESILVVTSDFHAARAQLLCEAAGIDDVRTMSVRSSGYSMYHRIAWRAREVVADARGLVDAWIKHPKVAVGGDPINIYDDCELQRSLSADDETRKLCEDSKAPRGARI